MVTPLKIIIGASLALHSLWLAAAPFDALEFRNLGPTRGGRVTAVAGTVAEQGTFYLGAAGGGVWKSTDYGTRWNNVSDGFFASPSIGAIAVSQKDPNILFVGTGSEGLRSNVIPGKGVYKSIDGGRNWLHVGLEKTAHIGAVEMDPRSNNTLWVAAIGNAFAPNEERGVYKTSDGGETWDRVLYVSNRVGFADVELLPGNPDVVFATAWKTERKPWTIISGGEQEEGGLYKSVDGGASWRRIDKGLPQGLIGRMDVAVSAADSRIVYLLVEAPGDEGGLYRSEDQGESFTLMANQPVLRARPFYFGRVAANPHDADDVHVMAVIHSRTRDGGKTWESLPTPHGDNHDLWFNPEKRGLFIQANDGGANVTHNDGASWSTQFNQPTVELYQVEVDDQYPYWLYAGQQDNSTTIAVPSRAPYGVQHQTHWLIETGGCETGPAVPKPGNHNIVYANCKGRFGVFDKRTGTERSYAVGATNMYGQNPGNLRYRFQRVAPIHVSPHDPDTVYHASQFVHRTRDEGVTWETLSPDLTAFDADRQVISGGPITRDITGEEFYSTIYSLRESPLQPGVIWVGANDGPVHVTRDNGNSWENVTPRGLPPGGRVDSVEPSPHDPAVAYVTFLRYQLGDPKPYIYRTTDFGKRWTLLSRDNGIPMDHPVRVVRADPERPGLLYAGTEFGLFVSFDDGESWQSFQQNVPVTPITDIKLHRGDLVLSTMGRGFWVLDQASVLSQAPLPNTSDSPVLFRTQETVRYRQNMRGYTPDAVPQYPEPAAIIDFQLPEAYSAGVRIEFVAADGTVVNAYGSEEASKDPVVEDSMALSEVRVLSTPELTARPGLNRFHWNMRHRGAWHADSDKRFRAGPLAGPGHYTVRLHAGDAVLEQPLTLLPDPRVLAQGVTSEHIDAQVKLELQIVQLQSTARQLAEQLRTERDKLEGNTARAQQIEAALAALVMGKGIYMQPMLIDQISYLGYMMRGADQLPGEDAVQRFDELANELEQIRARVQS